MTNGKCGRSVGVGGVWETCGCGRNVGEMWDKCGISVGDVWEKSGRSLGEVWECVHMGEMAGAVVRLTCSTGCSLRSSRKEPFPALRNIFETPSWKSAGSSSAISARISQNCAAESAAIPGTLSRCWR